MTSYVPRFADLIVTTDPRELVASPIGRCYVGSTFAIWCSAPDLQGSILWGALEERSIRDMMEVGRFIHHRDVSPRRRSISDCRQLERAAADILLGFVTSARDDVGSWAQGLERQALIVPAGVGGIMIAGALPMTGIAHSMRVVHELDEALAFVDHPGAAAAHATASSIVAMHRGPSVLLSRLREQLGREHCSTTIERSAASLGMSTRTLQRELHELGTSYSSELRTVRLAVAELLLVQTDRKIESIAAQVGFGTASRMSASLRRERNITASELRAARAGER